MIYQKNLLKQKGIDNQNVILDTTTLMKDDIELNLVRVILNLENVI